jgi:hypothetical protein
MEEARAELIRCSGTQFDETVVNSFIRILDAEELEMPTRRDPIAADDSPRLTLVAKRQTDELPEAAVPDGDMPAIPFRGAA